MKFLITGANGFVGKQLCVELLRQGQSVRAVVRIANFPVENIEAVAVSVIDGRTDWSNALRGVDVVIHLAARVHVMHDNAADPLAEFRKVNLHGTANLAQQAARAGVKRLVYVSSVKVNGESTLSPPSTRPLVLSAVEGSGQAKPSPRGGGEQAIFTEADIPSPHDPYAVSKLEAEQALHRVAQETGLEVVVIRPPLVYGPGVKGNFAQMLAVVALGIPLPLASVRNQRSLLYVGNLVDVLIVCATHLSAAGQTYLVSDGADISTPDLLRRLAVAMEVPPRLFPCQPSLLRLAGKLSGKSEQIERLLGSLQVDSDKIRRDLNWQPPYSLQQGLQATADWYRNTRP